MSIRSSEPLLDGGTANTVKQNAELKASNSSGSTGSTGSAGFNKDAVYANVDTNSKKVDLAGVTNAVFAWSGIICVVVIVVAGIMYVLSAGDPGKVGRAKQAITYAVVGLIIIASAFGIVRFILGGL